MSLTAVSVYDYPVLPESLAAVSKHRRFIEVVNSRRRPKTSSTQPFDAILANVTVRQLHYISTNVTKCPVIPDGGSSVRSRTPSVRDREWLTDRLPRAVSFRSSAPINFGVQTGYQ